MVVNATRVSSVVHLERRQGTQHQPWGSRRGRRNDQRLATQIYSTSDDRTMDCNMPDDRDPAAFGKLRVAVNGGRSDDLITPWLSNLGVVVVDLMPGRNSVGGGSLG
ncbi:hypothetical protein PoB_002566000 [Plakobranchus ocellatus]|uniref:Uncharacterized protein n=1 Tax=Plakobranchus ocellatus TaxID=259542 RepID=A0AAV3ZTJ5_9GAST|nr:hypothetical protein PoB_002566000 [Plakobranchus ocellatus]